MTNSPWNITESHAAQIDIARDYNLTFEKVDEIIDQAAKDVVEAKKTEIKRFKVGETYSTRSACDYDCVFSYTVKKRTAKFITIEDKHGRVRRVGVKVWGNEESAYPEGTYSMCPVISA